MEFQAKLGCYNCGMEDFYIFPIKTNINGWSYDEDGTEETSFVTYRGKELDLNCKNCKLPYLHRSEFWQKEQLGLRTNN